MPLNKETNFVFLEPITHKLGIDVKKRKLIKLAESVTSV